MEYHEIRLKDVVEELTKAEAQLDLAREEIEELRGGFMPTRGDVRMRRRHITLEGLVMVYIIFSPREKLIKDYRSHPARARLHLRPDPPLRLRSQNLRIRPLDLAFFFSC